MNQQAQYSPPAGNVYSRSELVASEINSVPLDSLGGWAFPRESQVKPVQERGDAVGFLARMHNSGNQEVVAYADTTDQAVLSEWLFGKTQDETAMTLASRITQKRRSQRNS